MTGSAADRGQAAPSAAPSRFSSRAAPLDSSSA
jgi:hypothetical protein